MGKHDDGAAESIGKLLRVPPDGVDLAAIDPAGTPGLPGKSKVRKHVKRWARDQLTVIGAQLATYQEQLYASAKVGDSRARVLLLLQAMDCGGKDGATKHVAGTMNPQGLRIVGFGKPTEEELAHDFLWRIRRALPEPGSVGVFNRSQYEDVLVARVHRLVDEATWRGRYQLINEFERELTDSGTVIVKVMLHISFEEQTRRLSQRLTDPTRHWKYNPADVDERAYWPEYQQAYQDALGACSTDYAPWHVVPADHKWYRDWAVARLLAEAMAGLGLTYPPGNFNDATELARLAASTHPDAMKVKTADDELRIPVGDEASPTVAAHRP